MSHKYRKILERKNREIDCVFRMTQWGLISNYNFIILARSSLTTAGTVNRGWSRVQMTFTDSASEDAREVNRGRVRLNLLLVPYLRASSSKRRFCSVIRKVIPAGFLSLIPISSFRTKEGTPLSEDNTHSRSRGLISIVRIHVFSSSDA